MLVLEEEADVRRDVLRQRRVNDKHYVYDRVFSEESTQVCLICILIHITYIYKV